MKQKKQLVSEFWSDRSIFFKHEVAEPDAHILPMAGWHPNYFHFSDEQEKRGTVTMIGDRVSIFFENSVISFSLETIVDFAVEEIKRKNENT